METEKPSEPDSTTLEKDIGQEFHKDEDVLCLNSKDGCFYLGTIVQVDNIYKKCLVEFLDNTKTWSSFKDLKSFAPQEIESCYICKKSHSESDNKIIVCKCGRSCHQLCHEPHIPSNSISDWSCKICIPTYKRREEKSASKKAVSNHKSQALESLTSVSQLPYNPDALTWDAHHRVNQEGQYCYCGGPGSWNMNMIQCRRCRQWFHSKCASSIVRPVFCGDRFYVFICSLCNSGKEYSRRLVMKWPDLVHLVLYNLTLIHQVKYYDLETSILPYINEYWDDFQLPPLIAKANIEERRSNIIDCLVTCEKRFKSGREIKKRSNLWGLRFRVAPKAPPLSLPPRGPVDDNALRIYCKKNFVTSELENKSLQNGYVNSSHTRSRQVEIHEPEHKIVPPLVINVPKPHSTTQHYRVSEREVARKTNDNQTTDYKVISSTEYHGRGLVKRSTPFPASDQASNIDTRFRSHAVRKARRLLNKNMKRKNKTAETSVLETSTNLKREKQSNVSHKGFSLQNEDIGGSRKRTRKSQSPEIRKRPQRNLLEARLNSTESKLYNPFTPVDSSEAKKSKNVVPDQNKRSFNSESVTKKQKSLRTKFNEKLKTSKPKLVQKTIFDSFNIKNNDKSKIELLPIVSKYKIKEGDLYSGDSKSNSVKSEKVRRSGGSIRSESLERTQGESDLGVETTDDEASSRGTLEPFIPTPKDFDGQNNPFRSVTDLLNSAVGIVPTAVPPITLPLPLKTVIPHTDPPRLKKRQLSEKDIIIDRNGQVKRRRRHRRNRNGLIPRTIAPGTASKSAQITPSKNNKKHWSVRNDNKTLQPLVNNCTNNALNGMQLRTREPIKVPEKQISSTVSTPVKQSPSKDSVTISDDLESSVKYFFGAASRIESGEKYEIRAKRVTLDGKIQCIIEWKGLPT